MPIIEISDITRDGRFAPNGLLINLNATGIYK